MTMNFKNDIDNHINKINEQFEIVNQIINQINELDIYYFEIKQQLDYYKKTKKFMFGYQPTKNEVICLNLGLKQTKDEAMSLRIKLDEEQSKARRIKREHEKEIAEIKEQAIAKIKIDQ